MKNYPGLLMLDATFTDTELDTALDLLGEEDTDLAQDITAVLRDADKRLQYQRLHRQYLVMADICDRIDMPAADTHQWQKRLVEFQDLD